MNLSLITPNQPFCAQRGFSLVEMLMVVALIAILILLAGLTYYKSLAVTYEKRAIANMRTIIHAEFGFYALRSRFGTFQQLISEAELIHPTFQRSINGTGGSETVSDGRYDYSLRFDTDARGFTLDADPKAVYAARYQRFRYRFRDVSNGAFGVFLVSAPSVRSPPESAYTVFNP